MVKVLFRRPCHVPPCLINGEGGSSSQSLADKPKSQSQSMCLKTGDTKRLIKRATSWPELAGRQPDHQRILPRYFSLLLAHIRQQWQLASCRVPTAQDFRMENPLRSCNLERVSW